MYRWVQRSQRQSMPGLPRSAQHQQLRSGVDSLTVREKVDRINSAFLKAQNALVQRAESFSGM